MVNFTKASSRRSSQPWRSSVLEIDQWYYIKIKSFCSLKNTIRTVKREVTEWETIFIIQLANKRLLSNASIQIC